MTTEYSTKRQALEMGLFYGGFEDEKLRIEKLENLLKSKPKKEYMGFPQLKHPIEVYALNNPKGDKVKIGIGTFREGYELWLIHPKTGLSLRA